VSQRLIPTGERSWIVDAHRDYGKRVVVRADERLTAFVKLQAAIRVTRAASYSDWSDSRPVKMGLSEIKEQR
jgi:hypothetical protein